MAGDEPQINKMLKVGDERNLMSGTSTSSGEHPSCSDYCSGAELNRLTTIGAELALGPIREKWRMSMKVKLSTVAYISIYTSVLQYRPRIYQTILLTAAWRACMLWVCSLLGGLSPCYLTRNQNNIAYTFYILCHIRVFMSITILSCLFFPGVSLLLLFIHT